MSEATKPTRVAVERVKARGKLNKARNEAFKAMQKAVRPGEMFGDKLYALEHAARAVGRASERWSVARRARTPGTR